MALDDVDRLHQQLYAVGLDPKRRLMNTQIEGLRFVLRREANGEGGILAHDPGLGKTLQMLCAHALNPAGGTLVVCKKSIVETWYAQTREHFCGTIPVLVYRGNNKAWTSWRHGRETTSTLPLNDEILDSHALIVTHAEALTHPWADLVHDRLKAYCSEKSNAYARSDDDIRSLFPFLRLVSTWKMGDPFPHLEIRVESKEAVSTVRKRMGDAGWIVSRAYGRVVIDESHEMRNPKVVLSTLACALVARTRWCLSGTPTVNDNKDVWSQLRFVRLRDLGTFADFGKALKRSREFEGKLKSLDRLRESGFVPENSYKRKRAEMEKTMSAGDYHRFDKIKKTAFHEAHKGILSVITFGDTAVDTNSAGTRSDPVVIDDPHAKLEAINRAYAHLGEKLLVAPYQGIPAAYIGEIKCKGTPEMMREHDALWTNIQKEIRAVRASGKRSVAIHVLAKINLLRQFAVDPNPWLESKTTPPKFEAVRRYISERMQPDEKLVVFCDYIEPGEKLARYLSEAGISAESVNGKSPDRDDAMRRFTKKERPRVLVSTDILAVGVTLVRANHVLLQVPWWNEALGEQQPWERVHRPGQTRPVHVNHVILEGSIDEMVRKKCIAKSMAMGESPKSSELLSLLGIA
jgi:SNF2 family DNA or RNA helicase